MEVVVDYSRRIFCYTFRKSLNIQTVINKSNALVNKRKKIQFNWQLASNKPIQLFNPANKERTDY